MIKHRYKISVVDMARVANGRENIGVIATTFGDAERIVNEFNRTNGTSYSIQRILRVEQVPADTECRVLSLDEVMVYQRKRDVRLIMEEKANGIKIQSQK